MIKYQAPEWLFSEGVRRSEEKVLSASSYGLVTKETGRITRNRDYHESESGGSGVVEH